MKRAARASEVLYLIAAALLLAWQLLVAPIVGLADSGDYPRVTGPFRIGYRPGAFAESQYNYLVRRFEIRPQHYVDYGFRTSESVFVRIALLVNRLTVGRNTFDIRCLGAVHAAALLGCFALLAKWSRQLNPVVRWFLLILALLTFVDTAYVAFFNSFYSESASILFLLATIGGALLTIQKASPRNLALFTIAAIGLVWAKPQHAPAGLLLGLLCVRLGMGEGRRSLRRWAVAGAVIILLAAIWSFRTTPRFIRDWSYEVAVLWEILGHSPDPAADALWLGVDPALVRYAGMHPWSPGLPPAGDPELRRIFLDRMTFAKIAKYYLTHPARAHQTLDRVTRAGLRTRPARLGNLEASAGFPPGALSHKFDAASTFKERIAPSRFLILGGLLVLYGSALLAIWTRSRQRQPRLMVELAATIFLIAISEFVIVGIAQSALDAAKHLTLFRAALDVLLIFAVVSMTAEVCGRLARRRGRPAPETWEAARRGTPRRVGGDARTP